jgi:CRISPR-associated protein Csx16
MNIIVTRHTGAVEWLQRKGFEGEIISSLDESSLPKEQVVIGVLPLTLAVELLKRRNDVYIIQFPPRSNGPRGVELDADEMEANGARLYRFGLKQSCFCGEDGWVVGARAHACNRCGQGYHVELALEPLTPSGLFGSGQGSIEQKRPAV